MTEGQFIFLAITTVIGVAIGFARRDKREDWLVECLPYAIGGFFLGAAILGLAVALQPLAGL